MATTMFIALSVILASGVAAIVYIYYKYRYGTHLDPPDDVVILYQVGRGPRAPSISPFPMKLETFLRMAKIPYMNDHSAKFSEKGKTPWMRYNGVSVADSQLCIEHLKEKRNIDVASHLSEDQRAVARGFLKLTEENLYWTMCIEMFGDDISAVKTVIPYRGLKLWMTLWILRRVIRKETWGHGIGRHTKEEVWGIAKQDMKALSDYLGTKPFMMGDIPSEIDCSVFGMLAQILWHMPGSRHELFIKESLPSLIHYCERMKERFWPDWDACTLTGSKYVPDHGKLYFSEFVPDAITSKAAINGSFLTISKSISFPVTSTRHGSQPGTTASKLSNSQSDGVLRARLTPTPIRTGAESVERTSDGSESEETEIISGQNGLLIAGHSQCGNGLPETSRPQIASSEKGRETVLTTKGTVFAAKNLHSGQTSPEMM